MRFLLSVRTVYPVSGRKVWYDDQRRVHEQIERGDELVDYAFMGDNPDAADNRWLREAHENGILTSLALRPSGTLCFGRASSRIGQPLRRKPS